MRASWFAWMGFALLVSVGFGSAIRFAWDPGAVADERDAMPGARTHGRSVFFTYWSTGFGGK